MTSVVLPKIIRDFCNPKVVRRWEIGIRNRLPDHYKLRMHRINETLLQGTTKPVHYDAEPGIWKPGPHTDTILPVQNRPIPVIYPAEADLGLWGGEGIIKGYVQRRFRAPRAPKIWTPVLTKATLYSEILDKHMRITVTKNAMLLIDEAYGLDNYILKTPEQDLHSNLALKLKQKMVEVLIDQSLYPDDPVEREKVYNKYKDCVTYTREEVEWLGLSEQEAIEKQKSLEAVKPIPLKLVYAEMLKKKAAESRGELLADKD